MRKGIIISLLSLCFLFSCPVEIFANTASGTVKTTFRLKDSLKIQSVSDLDFGKIDSPEPNTSVLNISPLVMVVADNRDEKSSWKLNVKTEVELSNVGQGTDGYWVEIDSNRCNVFADNKEENQLLIRGNTFKSNEGNGDFKEFLAFRGGDYTRYKILWEIGQVRMYLPKNIKSGEYNIFTTWQVVDSI